MHHLKIQTILKWRCFQYAGPGVVKEVDIVCQLLHLTIWKCNVNITKVSNFFKRHSVSAPSIVAQQKKFGRVLKVSKLVENWVKILSVMIDIWLVKSFFLKMRSQSQKYFFLNHLLFSACFFLHAPLAPILL